MDLDDGHGVLIKPPPRSPGRQDGALIVDRRERVERVLVLLLVAPFDVGRAALQLDDPMLGDR